MVKKLNLGAGAKKLEGYINIDKAASVNPDMVVDLELCKLPFADNSVDEIYTEHTLEHIRNFHELIQEMLRVSKIGTIWIIDVPWHSSWGQANDPTHVRCFTHHSFDYYYKAMCWSHEVDNVSGKQLWPLKRYINFSQGVGWLDNSEPFEKGEVSVSFMTKLKLLWNEGLILATLGFHECDFCEIGKKARSSREKVLMDKENKIKYIIPEMIFHYIEKHGYKPQKEFIEFVMRT